MEATGQARPDGPEETRSEVDVATLWPPEPLFLRGWRTRPQLLSQLTTRLAWANNSTLFSHPTPPVFSSHSDSDDEQYESSQSSDDDDEERQEEAAGDPAGQELPSAHAATQTSSGPQPAPSSLFSILNRWLEQYSRASAAPLDARLDGMLRSVRSAGGQTDSSGPQQLHPQPHPLGVDRLMEPSTPLQMSEPAMVMSQQGGHWPQPQLSHLRVRQLSSGQGLQTAASNTSTVSYASTHQQMQVNSPPGRLPSISAVSDGSDTPIAWSSALGVQGGWVLQHALPGQVSQAGDGELVSPWQMQPWQATADSPSAASAATQEELARWAQPRFAGQDEQELPGQGIIPTHAVLHTQTSLISLESLEEPAWGGSGATRTVDQAIQTSSSSTLLPSSQDSGELPLTTDQATQASLSSSGSITSITIGGSLSIPPVTRATATVSSDTDALGMWQPASALRRPMFTDVSFDLVPEPTSVASTQTRAPAQVTCYGYGSLLGGRMQRILMPPARLSAPAMAPALDEAATPQAVAPPLPPLPPRDHSSVRTVSTAAGPWGTAVSAGQPTVVPAGARIPRLSAHQVSSLGVGHDDGSSSDDDDDDYPGYAGRHATTVTSTEDAAVSHVTHDDVESVIQDVVDSVVRDTAAAEAAARPRVTTSRFAGASDRLAQLLRRGAELAGVGSATGMRGFGRGAGTWGSQMPSRPAWHPSEISRHQARIRQALSTRYWSNDPPDGNPLLGLGVPDWAARFHPSWVPPCQQPATRQPQMQSTAMKQAQPEHSRPDAVQPPAAAPPSAPAGQLGVQVTVPAFCDESIHPDHTCSTTQLTSPLPSPGGTVMCSVRIHPGFGTCVLASASPVSDQPQPEVAPGDRPSGTSHDATCFQAMDAAPTQQGAANSGTDAAQPAQGAQAPAMACAHGSSRVFTLASAITTLSRSQSDMPPRPQAVRSTPCVHTISTPGLPPSFESARPMSWAEAGRRASGRGADHHPPLLARTSVPARLNVDPPATPSLPALVAPATASILDRCDCAHLGEPPSTTNSSTSSLAQPVLAGAPDPAALLLACNVLPKPLCAMKELYEWLMLRGVNVQAEVVNDVLQCLSNVPVE